MQKIGRHYFFCETLTKNVIVNEQGQTCICLSETVAIWVSLMQELAVKTLLVYFSDQKLPESHVFPSSSNSSQSEEKLSISNYS